MVRDRGRTALAGAVVGSAGAKVGAKVGALDRCGLLIIIWARRSQFNLVNYPAFNHFLAIDFKKLLHTLLMPALNSNIYLPWK
jgi:hypothetical protein